MKNKVTFLGLIIITMIIGVSLTSCGGVEAALEGEWEADALLGYSIVIGKDSFTQKALGIESKLGDKVSASNGKITVKLSSAEVGTAIYNISSNKLTLSSPTGFFITYANLGISTWTAK